MIPVLRPREPGDRPQSLKEIEAMVSGNPYRTVRTCQMLLQGDNLSFDQVKDSAEHVIEYVNYKLKYVGYMYKRERPKARRTVGIPVPKDVIQQVLDTPQGVIECHGNLPETVGQVSRFCMAWWTRNDNLKYIRLFGDRIHLNHQHPQVPRLSPFGQNPYHIVFDADDPHHCLKCRKHLEIGQGVYEDASRSFVCEDCKYEEDTGLRQGINKLRKKKSR